MTNTDPPTPPDHPRNHRAAPVGRFTIAALAVVFVVAGLIAIATGRAGAAPGPNPAAAPAPATARTDGSARRAVDVVPGVLPVPPVQSGGAAERFTWPLAPPHPVLRPFQPPTTPYGPGHRGVDLGAPAGADVFAADSGVVLYAGPLAGRSLVSVEHPGGLRTTYEPVDPMVAVGRYVTRGEVVGHLLAGHPGCPATPPTACLHWGAHRQAVYLDPLRLVESGRIRLLPWPTGEP